ncbi:MAG: HYR domain-containing protein [Actinomycetota bacterium]|nr:HYR domain-containing protein [Actinomycetota bacterium]
MKALALALTLAAVFAPSAQAGAITLELPASFDVEATGPTSTSVAYTAWAEKLVGTDVKIVPISCAPGGSSAGLLDAHVDLAIGEHTVTCKAGTDAETVTGSFRITVRDTTPPTLLVPAPLDLGAAPTAAGVPKTDARIAAFLASAHATDAVDASPLVSVDAPLVFPVGTTSVRFSAADRFENVRIRTSTVTVGPPPAQLAVTTSILTPRNGARLSAPPVLRWRAIRGASYYNVQLWRAGRKILSRWPLRPRLALRARWRYAGRSYRLRPARYRWYVWPGYGLRSAAEYGGLAARGRFRIVRR